MTSRLIIWICEAVELGDGSDREGDQAANFWFGVPLKSIVARRWFDHDGSLGGDYADLPAGELLECARKAADQDDDAELSRLISILEKLKPEATVAVAIRA